MAGERKFLVILASSPKQYPSGGQPPGGFVSPQLIHRQYFDTISPVIGSFAEYWEEISYGDVQISGRVTDWIDLPWAIQPPLVTPGRHSPATGPPIDDNLGDQDMRLNPANFIDLSGDGVYEYGNSERFNNLFASAIVDMDGDPNGTDNGPFEPGIGSREVSQRGTGAGRPVWMPGERYVDVDEDGKWDGRDENRNQMDWDFDGMPDLLGPWIDLNQNGTAETSDTCVFLSDSDNDGFPDCCPQGRVPGRPMACNCPPLTWMGPNDVMITDCNGNSIDDAIDIADGTSRDQLPFVNEGDACVPGEPDGIPDECQFINHTAQCATMPGNGCVRCMPVAPGSRTPQPRCEYVDGNRDTELNIVEPFENFLRRWDPCLEDPDVSAQNVQTLRAHWIKVYDPNSDNADTPISCSFPAYSVRYDSPAYITNNYPGNPQLVINQASQRMLWGAHDPLGRLAAAGVPCECISPDTGARTPCRDVLLPNGETLEDACHAGWHVEFNPGDSFTNAVAEGPGGTMVTTTKMQAHTNASASASVRFATATPKPGDHAGTGDAAWYPQAWTDRYVGECYNPAGVAGPCTAPDWPTGFASGRRVPNTLRMVPFDDTDPDGFDETVDRRYFKANFGGINGDGTGWLPADMANVVFETGPLGEVGFEEAMNRPILPEETDTGQPAAFFDGYVEHDDLPSSKYHQGGDERLGEVTSPFFSWISLGGAVVNAHDPAYGTLGGMKRIAPIWGTDLGDHNPNRPQLGGDEIIPAAGPYAVNVHGAFGRDGGNLLLLELMTWRTDGTNLNNGVVWESWHGMHHPYAGPGTQGLPNENLGFRDYNLDGLVDQGEVRPAGSENYIADSDISTPDTGTNTNYPWNRQRLLEDCVELLDDGGLDFDDFVDSVAMDAITCGSGPLRALLPSQFLTPPLTGTANFATASGICSGIVLLPVLAHKAEDFPLSPGFYPIHNQDGLNDPSYVASNFPVPSEGRERQLSWNIFFHDLVISLGVSGESPTIGFQNFQTGYSAHEYLHAWERFPDLYDYDVFAPPGPEINCPIGAWDIMAYGGLVHPTPVLKELPCTAWIESVDLTTVLTPGVDKVLTLPPAEFVRDDSYFFIENEDLLGERFYFWSAGSGFDEDMPGPGMLVLHTDVGANPDAIPPLNRTGTHYTYYIVQADGNDELTPCTDIVTGQDDIGDAGDPWPGVTRNTRFNCNTNPASQWYTTNACTGLSVLDVVPDAAGSTRVTMNWVPTTIPSLRFIDPPGGATVTSPLGVIYQVRAEATDVYGGTWMRFFYAEDDASTPSIDVNGANFIGIIKKNGPGTNTVSVDWNVDDVPDGRYSVFAELIPDAGADGVERSSTVPRPARNNVGNGTLMIDEVESNEIVASALRGGNFPSLPRTSFRAESTAGAPINFVQAGVVVGDQLMVDGFVPRAPALRMITRITGSGTVLNFTPAITGGLAGSVPWQVVRGGRDARSETWQIECINGAGTEWRVLSSLTQPEPPPDAPNQDPYPHAMTGVRYTSVNGAVQFTITAGSTPFALGDAFAFVTTGITAFSRGVSVLSNQITENPTAVILAAPLSGDPPLRVTFDGRSSSEPNGEPLTFQWDFGDGSAPAIGPQQTHTFMQARTFAVTLKVTNMRTGLFDEAVVDVAVTNNSPNAVITAVPTSGRPPLEVRFNAAGSNDTETTANNLIYQWNFGDNVTVNDAGTAGPAFQSPTHLYTTRADGTPCTPQSPCNFVATLTVTDDGGKQDTATAAIIVGNSRPVATITHTTIQGPNPWEVVFNGLNSFDPDPGDTIMIEWRWGDGTPNQTLPRTGVTGATDGSVPHTYRLAPGTTAGSFTTTAIVRDSHGAETMWPGVMVLVNQATVGSSDPRAIFTITPNPPIVREPFTVDGRLSFDRPAGRLIASYSWNWGDGTPAGSGVSATHTYASSGTYRIALTVADGETPPNTNTSTQTVVVAADGDVDDPTIPSDNRRPVARLGVTPAAGTGFANETEFVFDAADSSDPDGDDLTFRWTFGDGSSATGARVTHVYEESGNFLVRLTVRDEFNASTNATQAIVVTDAGANRPPQVFIATGPRTGTAPLNLTFDGRGSFDPDGDVLTYRWEFLRDDEVIATASDGRVTRLFETPGRYTVTLEVSDGRGGTATSPPEILTVLARVGPAPEPGTGQDVPGDGPGPIVRPQRPAAFCGLGMLMSLFGSLLGLLAMLASRRRARL